MTRLPCPQNFASVFKRIDSLDCVIGVGRISNGGGGRIDEIFCDEFKALE